MLKLSAPACSAETFKGHVSQCTLVPAEFRYYRTTKRGVQLHLALRVTGWNHPYSCFKQQQKQASVKTNLNECSSLWFHKGSCALNTAYSASLGNHFYWPVHAKQTFHRNRTVKTISATYNPTMSTRPTFSNVYVALPLPGPILKRKP